MWVESERGAAVTPARAALMRQVLRYTSLAEAARALRIPYKKAHLLAASFDERLGGGVVARASGGAEGGSTVLGSEGQRLLQDYERLCNLVFETLANATLLGAPVEVAVPGLPSRAQAASPPAGAPAPAAPFSELYRRARTVSGHNCPGMVLGVRMAVSAMSDLGMAPLENHARLRVTVETRRCAADAIQAVSDTSFGRSSFAVEEYGKLAATFGVVGQEVAVRVVALESSRLAADALLPEVKGKKERQMRAYARLPDEALLQKGRVRLLEAPRRSSRAHPQRAVCPGCSEAFEPPFGLLHRGELFCRACAGGSYFEPFARSASPA